MANLDYSFFTSEVAAYAKMYCLALTNIKSKKFKVYLSAKKNNWIELTYNPCYYPYSLESMFKLFYYVELCIHLI